MATINYTDGVTPIPAAWLNDIDAFYYELFGATGGLACIGDTTNANMTIGLTINQGAADNEILALKSSDIAHGLTDVSETDTYGMLKKGAAATGGLNVSGFSDGAGAGAYLIGHQVTADTTKSTAGLGAVAIHGRLKSGTGVASVGANANILVVVDESTTRFIFDAEGSFHADVESTTFDAYDDLALLEAMDVEFQRRNGDPVKAAYVEHLREHKETLQRLGIVNYYDPEGKRAMVNLTKQAMLHNGAIRQLARRFESLERKLLTHGG